MPILTIITNAPENYVTKEILQVASKLVADIFNVSEKNVLISIKAGIPMLWGNDDTILGLGTLQNTEQISTEQTKNQAPQIFEFLEKYLKIPQSRMYLKLIKLKPANIAVSGQTLQNALQN